MLFIGDTLWSQRYKQMNSKRYTVQTATVRQLVTGYYILVCKYLTKFNLIVRILLGIKWGIL